MAPPQVIKCNNTTHCHSTRTHLDYHLTLVRTNYPPESSDYQWKQCSQQYCPNRYTLTSRPIKKFFKGGKAPDPSDILEPGPSQIARQFSETREPKPEVQSSEDEEEKAQQPKEQSSPTEQTTDINLPQEDKPLFQAIQQASEKLSAISLEDMSNQPTYA